MTTGNQSLRQVVLPIRVGIDPMERLLVASFKGDPEFEGFAPQIFDDPINGKGMRVLRYRKDGKVDVYWQPGVRVDRSTFTVGAGIGDFAETTIDPSHFEITQSSLDLQVAFTDAQGRKVELRVREDTHGKRGFPLLAPVGADIKQPRQLFLVYMPCIDLVRRTGSIFEGRVGDRVLRPASLPILLDCKPLIIEMPAPGSAQVDGMIIVADEKGSITRISAGLEPPRVEVDFLPGFPNLPDIPQGDSPAGRWSIWIMGVPITGGSYHASREGDRVAVELDVTENWKPSGLPFCMEIFTRVVSMFRTWPATYRWCGVVELGAEPIMSGVWERKGRR